MKYLKNTFLTVTMFLFLSTVVYADIGNDKYQHAIGCTGIYIVTNEIIKTTFPDLTPTQRILISSLFTLSIGLTKELYDDHIDNGDLTADAVGVLTGIMITIAW